jgi:hypothetical protein
VSYCLFEHTKDPAALDDAIAYERKAIDAWQSIVNAAGDTYAPDLMFGARSRDLCGHWRDELEALKSGLVKLEAERKEIPVGGQFAAAPHCVAFTNEPVRPVIVHEPVLTASLNASVKIRAHVTATAGVKWVQVLYRSVDQTKDYTVLDMKAVDENGNYEATIPAEKINPRYDLMYLIQAMDKNRHGVMYPDFNGQTPYYIVQLQRKE